MANVGASAAHLARELDAGPARHEMIDDHEIEPPGIHAELRQRFGSPG